MQALRGTLESKQIPLYFCAVAVAALTALFVPATTALESLITPALAVMLYATFLQVPIAELKKAFGGRATYRWSDDGSLEAKLAFGAADKQKKRA
mgnify:CR=1 FL=1